MQTFCQWLVALNLVVAFFSVVYQDINGRPAKAPKGFEGFVVSCITIAVVAAVTWGAGAFSVLFGQ